MLETPEAFDDWPPKPCILLIEKAKDYPEMTADFLEFPEGPPPDSTLLPEPGLFN